MRNYCCSILACVATFFTPARAHGAITLQEDFNSDPAARNWRAYGDASLFSWNSTNQNLEVTWNSSQTNSFFYHPVGTLLARNDDFSLAFDLRLSDVTVGTTPGKPYTFQLVIGLINFANAASTNFLRGTGTDSPNLVEFDYFPDSGFGATISPTIISSNNEFASSFNFPLELTTNDLFHVAMAYTASNHALVTTVTRNGAPFDLIQDAVLGTNFSDFRVDSVAVCSYSDAGQDPQFAGSILAHGAVDNITLTTPEPPVQNLNGRFAAGVWEVEFAAQANWLYTLERTDDLEHWSAASPSKDGTGGLLTLSDTNAPTARSFYRVRAERP